MPARFQKAAKATFNYPYNIPAIGHDEREIAVTLPRNVGHALAKSPVTMARNTHLVLYRGINQQADEANGGHLVPKGTSVEVVPKADGKWKHDGKFKRGSCESNTARAHQIESGLYGGCGISTSRSELIAIRFATSEYMENGYVYVIDEELFGAHNVAAYEFSDPLNPHEQEVTLIENTGSFLPEAVIVEKYAVSSDGKRT